MEGQRRGEKRAEGGAGRTREGEGEKARWFVWGREEEAEQEQGT